MKGTEKQIKWASDIKAKIIEIIDALIADGERCAVNPEFAAMQSKIKAKLDALNDQKNAIENCETSWDIIDCFERVSNAKEFASRCRVHLPQNETQKRLLGR